MFRPEDALLVLTDEQLETIHNQAMDLLEQVGLDVFSEGARAVFAGEGQRIEGTRVHIDREWVMDEVAKIPSEFTVRPRNPDREIRVGGGSRVLLPTGGSPFVSDLERGRRTGTIEAHDELAKLAHAANVLTCLQAAMVEAMDLPVSTRHMDMDYSCIRHSDKPYIAYGASAPKVRDSIRMAEIWAGGREAIEQQTAMFVVVNPISPLVWDERMSDVILETAAANQALVITPFLLAGATASVSTAGALSIQVAEALSGAALAQAVRPGAPCLYGSFFTPLDMRTGAPAFGLPQALLATLAGGQLARRYGMPYRGGGALASGNVVDAQAASESLNSLWATYLSSSDFVLHAAGWLEGGLTASFEKFALDVEILTQFELTAQGIGFSDGELAFDEIVKMGPAGMYLESEHTMAHFREWMYMSQLFSTTDFETWQSMGAVATEQRAVDAWKKLMDSWEDPGIDSGVDEELKDYIGRRKAEEAEKDPDE